MKAFTVTMPADTNYHSLWDLLIAITGWIPANAIVPDRGCYLSIGPPSGALNISDSDFANVAGISITTTSAPFVLQSPVNSICLKEIYVKGNAIVFSGWFLWK